MTQTETEKIYQEADTEHEALFAAVVAAIGGGE